VHKSNTVRLNNEGNSYPMPVEKGLISDRYIGIIFETLAHV
jgi:hypothetical protein